MAEDKPASERTEEPTEERIRKAREEGQIANSQEVPSALLLGVLLVAMSLMAGPMLEFFSGLCRQSFTRILGGSLHAGHVLAIIEDLGVRSLVLLAPLLAAAAGMSIFSSAIVGGLVWCPKAAKLKLDRISPVKGTKQLLSKKSLVRLLVSVLKLVVLAVLVGLYLADRLGEMMALHWSTPYVALAEMARLVGGMLIRIILAMAVIAGLDWLWQRYSWKKQLRMTRQELKEERRQYEPAPEIRSKIRGIQQSMARRRMLQDVSEADVVLTNPTHVSVALKYNAGEMEAPLVLAKGADLLAQKIREVAKANGVPVVERPPLARALYAAVEVGQQIPESLFVAVAEVLAMVYRTQKHRTH